MRAEAKIQHAAQTWNREKLGLRDAMQNRQRDFNKLNIE
jgi:hypothetical protein